MSAATLVFLGGRLRYFESGAKFGVHQFSFRDPSPDNIGRSQILSAKIALYVVEVGISPDFLSAIFEEDENETLVRKSR
ncbi:Putative periplasmic protein (fragment) [Mesorhizobium prunaredense]|uniref:Putative periplasmic protein n=1 Tax=Mesorhizobium prunaredense TaxID=1631249 RepID=A0A1R3VHR4_9HYPH